MSFIPKIPDDLSPWTIFDIRWENAKPDEERFQSVVWMRCVYETPRRWPIQQTHTIRFDRPTWTSRFLIPTVFRGSLEFGFNNAERVAEFGTRFKDLTVTWQSFEGEELERQVFNIKSEKDGGGVRFRNITLGAPDEAHSAEESVARDFTDVGG